VFSSSFSITLSNIKKYFPEIHFPGIHFPKENYFFANKQSLKKRWKIEKKQSLTVHEQGSSMTKSKSKCFSNLFAKSNLKFGSFMN
jgi:hypothetical protein